MNEFISKYKLLLVVALVVVVGGGAWLAAGGDNGGSQKASSPVNKEVQDKCMVDVNDELFCKFAGAFASASAYKVSANITGSEGTSTLELASDAKDNSQMVVKQNGQEQANIVFYNGVTYSKDYTDGQWFKYGSGDSNKPEVTDLKKEFAKGDFKTDDGRKISYVKSGTEKCDSLSCYKYQVNDPSKPNEEGFIWFDTKDYLLRRISIKDDNTSTDMTVIYSSVNISQPSPTKDVPSASSSDQSQSSADVEAALQEAQNATADTSQ